MHGDPLWSNYVPVASHAQDSWAERSRAAADKRGSGDPASLATSWNIPGGAAEAPEERGQLPSWKPDVDSKCASPDHGLWAKWKPGAATEVSAQGQRASWKQSSASEIPAADAMQESGCGLWSSWRPGSATADVAAEGTRHAQRRAPLGPPSSSLLARSQELAPALWADLDLSAAQRERPRPPAAAAVPVAAAAERGAAAAPMAKHWWKDIEGEECPISLAPIQELPHEPFGLLGTIVAVDALPSGQGRGGLWGGVGAAAVRDGQVVHWFDGAFLASFLVSSSDFIDPVNRRLLTRAECLSLDAYLGALRLPAVHVTDAYDLLQRVSAKSSVSGDQSRMTALGREAASLLQSLFNFRGRASLSARRSGSGRPARPLLGPTTGIGGGFWDLGGAAEQVGDAREAQQRLAQSGRGRGAIGPLVASRRTSYGEDGLRVIDDGEFEEGPSGEDGPFHASDPGYDPTPAELAQGLADLASARAAATAATRAPRGPPRSTRAERRSAAAAAAGEKPATAQSSGGAVASGAPAPRQRRVVEEVEDDGHVQGNEVVLGVLAFLSEQAAAELTSAEADVCVGEAGRARRGAAAEEGGAGRAAAAEEGGARRAAAVEEGSARRAAEAEVGAARRAFTAEVGSARRAASAEEAGARRAEAAEE